MDEPNQPAEFPVGESFARTLTEATQSLVCVLDREGRILLFNEACERATGFRRHELIGRDARDFVIPPEERDAFGEFLEYVWTTGTPAPQVGHWLTRDGGRRLIAWSNKPMAGNDGMPASLVTTGIDLTDRQARDLADDRLEGDPEARLAEVSRLATEQRALRRVATLVASEVSPEGVFMAVSEECARVLHVNASLVVRYEGDDTATIVGRYARDEVSAYPAGDRLPATENTTIGRVLFSGAPARIDDYADLPGELPAWMARIGYKSTVAAPISVAGILWGAVVVASEERLPPESEARLGAFCELVSLAVASAQAKADLQSSRRRLVSAGDEERRRLERNLHDGAQQRLVALALTLRLARAKIRNAPEGAESLMDEASQQLEQALDELRELARGLHPAILTARGLSHALPALAAGLPIPVEIEVGEERHDPALEATVYFIAAEALTNIVKHAKANGARVAVSRGETMLRLEITDDGCGGADPGSGSGILGLHDRASAIGGQLTVISSPGRGTVVTATLPLEPLL
jgi:PAS domain S-box-containing protein